MSESEQRRIFQTNLNQLLRQHGKSQREVADAIGVSPQTFNTWCQGVALPRMGKIQMLADYFGVLKSQLVDENISREKGLSLSPIEKEIIIRYRTLSDVEKNMVLRSLGLDDVEEKNDVSAG